jgi:DNA-binding NarL/FixJ family response regulator
MRVVLVGREPDRDRLRPELVDAGFEIVAEAATISAAREVRTAAAALVVAQPDAPAPIRDGAVVQEPLTPRELEVLGLIAEGLPNKAIADALDISDQTVKFHVAAILAKLGAQNRTEAVRRALRRGLLVI